MSQFTDHVYTEVLRLCYVRHNYTYEDTERIAIALSEALSKNKMVARRVMLEIRDVLQRDLSEDEGSEEAA